MIRVGFLVALAALIVAPAQADAKGRARPAAKDWSQTFSVTADGGFRMGNPDAKVALVEYGSLTCPHCRHFAETALKPLVARYVRTGKASYEFRSFVLNKIDLAATLVARCDGPKHFFPVAEELYATQPKWLGRLSDAEEKLIALPEDQIMLGVAKTTGIIPLAERHGIAAAKAEACLKSQAAADELTNMAFVAAERGIQGTPTFFVNGKQVPAYDWATLEPFLKDGGG